MGRAGKVQTNLKRRLVCYPYGLYKNHRLDADSDNSDYGWFYDAVVG